MSQASAAKVLDEDLFGGGTAAPQAADASGVLSFPSKMRTQDVVLRLLLEGKSYQEIAEITHLEVAQVQSLARSEWAKAEITRRAESDPHAAEADTKNLLRVHCFDAVEAVSACLKGQHLPTKFQAAKWLLELFVDAGPTKAGKPLPKGEDALKQRLLELKRQIASEEKSSLTI